MSDEISRAKEIIADKFNCMPEEAIAIITSLLARVEELKKIIPWDKTEGLPDVPVSQERYDKLKARKSELEREVLRQKANATVDADEVQEAIRVTRRSALERAALIAQSYQVAHCKSERDDVKDATANAIKEDIMSEMTAEKGE